MEWFDKIWGWLSDKVGTFIQDSSWVTFALIALGALIILSVIGVVWFWWWLLNKAMNKGGDH